MLISKKGNLGGVFGEDGVGVRAADAAMLISIKWKQCAGATIARQSQMFGLCSSRKALEKSEYLFEKKSIAVLLLYYYNITYFINLI